MSPRGTGSWKQQTAFWVSSLPDWSSPDLILLDIALPQLSGLEVNRRLQSNPETATIPVLYLTGLIPDALRAGTAEPAYIAKPFSPQSLVERIDSILPKQPALT